MEKLLVMIIVDYRSSLVSLAFRGFRGLGIDTWQGTGVHGNASSVTVNRIRASDLQLVLDYVKNELEGNR